jgi:hypothetical protein
MRKKISITEGIFPMPVLMVGNYAGERYGCTQLDRDA